MITFGCVDLAMLSAAPQEKAANRIVARYSQPARKRDLVNLKFTGRSYLPNLKAPQPPKLTSTEHLPKSTHVTIWDVHCHLSGVPGRTPDERLGQLIEFADRMGIERLCVFMG